MNQRTLYSVAEASKELGCTQQYVRKLLKEGKINGFKVGNSWVIPVDEIDNINNKLMKKTNVQDQKSKIKYTKQDNIVLSFFSGAMGLDIGLHKSGFKTLLACEIDKASRKTILANNPQIGLIQDIRDYSTDEILDFAGLTKKDKITLIAGGPPCQAFSTAGKRMGLEDERGNVFLKFIEVIEELQPSYAVIENVRGLLYSQLMIDLPEEEMALIADIDKKTKGSTLYYITKKLERAGYHVSFNLYNSANYATPQKRERVIILCSKKDKIPYLTPTHSEKGEFDLPPWKTLKEALEGLKEIPKDFIKFPEKRLKYYRLLKAGQNWRNLPPELQKEAMGKSYFLGGGKTGFFRRLAWDKPSPTLVTHPAMPATDLGHPEEDRPLSVQEYKRIQEFPDDWEICGTIIEQYRQIGNAVPVSLGYAIGKEILIQKNGLNKTNKTEIDGFKYSRYKKTSDKEFLPEVEQKSAKEKDAAQGSIEYFVFLLKSQNQCSSL